MSFTEVYNTINKKELSLSILSKSSADVEHAIRKNGKRTIEDFKALISPAAAAYLEEMALLSNKITTERFGKTIQMYAPVYLSNECQNICTYCGFSYTNQVKRVTLSDSKMQKEFEILKKMKFDHVLLVTGEANKTVGTAYFRNALKIAGSYFSNITMEVQPMDQDDYEILIDEGLHAVLIYQETYDEEAYAHYHPKGKKSNFQYRLETPDRLGKAGIIKIGLGCLIGLHDWRFDAAMTAIHLQYLEKQYWKTRYSISFPRLRPALDVEGPRIVQSDKEFVQLICAWRICNPEVELSLSTRESIQLRNNLLRLGITTISAGSKTNPGGYAEGDASLGQFEIADERSSFEMESYIKDTGYEIVWKDWDKSLDGIA